MQHKLTQNEIRDSLSREIAYLFFLRDEVYYEEPGFFDYLADDIKDVFGIERPPRKSRHKYHIKITREDRDNIKNLIDYLEDVKQTLTNNPSAEINIQEFINSYAKGYTDATGLPAWVKSTLFLRATFENPAIDEQEKTLIEKLILCGDMLKRLTDLAEDTFSTLRSASLLSGISNDSLRNIIGAFNVVNFSFEFGKGIHDFHEANTGDAKYRPELLAEAGMRSSFSLLGVVACTLYILKILLLPFFLLVTSIVMLPIFVVLLAKDTWIYFDAKREAEESAIENTDSEFNKELARLLKIDKDKLTDAEHYQIASMQYRQKNDPIALTNAKREMKYTGIDLLAYLFIALASCAAISVFFATLPVQIIIGKCALAATIIGVTTSTIAKIIKHRHTILDTLKSIHNYLDEKVYTPVYDALEKNIAAITFEFVNTSDLIINKLLGEQQTKYLPINLDRVNINRDRDTSYESSDESTSEINVKLKKTTTRTPETSEESAAEIIVTTEQAITKPSQASTTITTCATEKTLTTPLIITPIISNQEIPTSAYSTTLTLFTQPAIVMTETVTSTPTQVSNITSL